MIEILVLALGVPTALAAASWATRRSWAPKAADTRGIALQTVIVIVVMLVIAGAVAGVLLSRGSEVTADLEAQDVTASIDTADECTATEVGGILGTNTGTTCRWVGTSSNPVTRGSCRIVRGTFYAAGVGIGAVTGGHAALLAASNTNGACQLAL